MANDPDAWAVLSETTVFDAPPFVRVTRQAVGLPDGRRVDDFYQVYLQDFAAIVPVMDDGTILTLRTYKHGPRRVSLTFPAGFVEPGEDAEAAARRELLEETGCVAATWRHLGSYTDNGNQGVCTGHYFLATGCRVVQDAASGDLEAMTPERHDPAALDAALEGGGFAITHMAAAWAFARRYLSARP